MPAGFLLRRRERRRDGAALDAADREAADLEVTTSPDARGTEAAKGKGIMQRKYDHDTSIIYVDPKGVRHTAIVTAWWGVAGAGLYDKDAGVAGSSGVHAYVSETNEPGCNLVYVAKDTAKGDPYGRQLERATSVVHKSKQPAHGNFWMWPDEV